MTGSNVANWLTVVGLVYAGIGVVLVAGALMSSSMLSGTSEATRARSSRSPSGLAGLGGLLAAIGFVLQGAGQFRVVELGPSIAVWLLGLMAIMALFAMGSLWSSGASVSEAPVATSAEPAALVAARVVAQSEPPVKLVSATGT